MGGGKEPEEVAPPQQNLDEQEQAASRKSRVLKFVTE
jgi:hypothetical protein